MGYGRGLAELIEGKQQRWPTPRANDAEKRGRIANDPRNGLPAAVMYWKTPTEDDCSNVNPKDNRRPGLVAQVKHIEGTGRLNPQWVEWLMGYPIGFTDLGDSAMPLSRKLPKR